MEVRGALIQLREELQMRQVDLSSALGISPITVVRWETGKNVPSRAMALAIIAFASNKKVSTVCQESLRLTLLHSTQQPGVDDLRYAEMDQINNLVNDSSNAVMVCDAKTHELLYINRQSGRMTGQPVEQAQGQKCYAFFLHRNTPCEDCPMKNNVSDEFFAMEYESPVTGRHYMRRSKTLTWSGKKAHLEYITDITELRKTGKALERSQMLTTLACKEADMWMFTLDIADGTAHIEPIVQKGLNLPATIPNFMNYLASHHGKSDENIAELLQILPKLRQGKTPIEITFQTKMASERMHWVLFRATIAEYDEHGTPFAAICSAQIIDREKAVETRIKFEHEHIIASRKNLMGYVISDITADKVLESRQLMDKGPFTAAGSVYSVMIEDARLRIEPSSDRAKFLKEHRREYLFDRFEQGELEQSLEYQLLQPDGTRIWVHTEMRLMPHPGTGNVLLYEYCYAVHMRKILKGLLRTIFRNGYDTVAAISFENDQVARLQFTENGELMEQKISFASYTKETEMYCAKHVVPEERDGFLQAMSVERVCKELKTRNSYRASYHEITSDGGFRTMVSEYTQCDEKYDFCLLTVWDQEAMRASINHVADATPEAIK